MYQEVENTCLNYKVEDKVISLSLNISLSQAQASASFSYVYHHNVCIKKSKKYVCITKLKTKS